MKHFITTILILLFSNQLFAKDYLISVNKIDETISLIDFEQKAVTHTIGVGMIPESLVVHPKGKYVYVANSGQNTISVVDLESKLVVDTIAVGNYPSALEISKDGNTLYILEYGGFLGFYDLINRTFITKISVGFTPNYMVLDRIGRYAYINNKWGNSVTCVDLEQKRVVSTIYLMRQPSGATVSYDNNKVYVPSFFAHGCFINIIDTATNRIEGNYRIPCIPTAITSVPNSSYLIITNTAGMAVIFDSVNRYVLTSLPVGTSPVAVISMPDGKQAVTANYGSNNLSVINIDNLIVSTKIGVGAGPTRVAYVNIDKTPPSISISLPKNQQILWPPNGKFVKITPNIEVSDDTDPHPQVRLVSIECNEETRNIYYSNADFGTDDRDFYLRAERSGKTTEGRIYKITYSAKDSSGNEAFQTIEILVPHDFSTIKTK